MSDPMVLATQRWLNATYSGRTGYNPIPEDGQTGWVTIYGLLHALQIELGITATADNFGDGTKTSFENRWPNGIKQQADGASETSNVYGIIQGALWCKGYSTGANGITLHFYNGTGSAIRTLKSDAGIGGDSTVTLDIMKALMSMDQFKLLSDYGGKSSIRAVQQRINRDYIAYTSLIPADGVYGRQMNTALIKVLQAIEGYSVNDATGNFGTGTTSNLTTITSANASSFPEWVWLGSVALLCNGYGSSATSSWSTTLSGLIRSFQSKYAIPQTGVFDKTTWMSLLTSKGDPTRAASACDTRFEITSELLAKLKADGYQIVGRYLTEPGMGVLLPENYFKAIRPGELQRIVDGGMKFFPIFQENSRQLSDFTEENGRRHGQEAYRAALANRIPPTVIYFAVDMDIMDYQIDSHIIPYFRAINSTLAGGYRVGIYASRNVCQRVIDAGYAVSAFVSDMSTGFSGNLGYPIPDQWNYDQFTEISGYGGKWDLDRVAYAGRVPAVSSLTPKPSTSITDTFALWIQEVENKYVENYSSLVFNEPSDSEAGSYVLGWLRKPKYWSDGYGSGLMWQTYTPEPTNVPENNIHRAEVERICSEMPSDIRTQISNEDLAHFAATCLGYQLYGTQIQANTWGLGDLGGWALDLLQIWGAFLNSGTTDSMDSWMSRHLGVLGDNRGFSKEDVLADADAYSLVHTYWTSTSKLSEALSKLRSNDASIRLREFYQLRFASSSANVKTAFWSLIDSWVGKTVPYLGGPLTWASHADRLPTKQEADELAELYANCLANS